MFSIKKFNTLSDFNYTIFYKEKTESTNNDALKKTKIEANKWSKKAKEEIQNIPQNPITILLQELADNIISRSS